jgi:hypothetical protein
MGQNRTSRADAIVDEDALLAALEAGTIAGAGLDVYDEEPLPGGHPVRSAPRIVLTPHLGYVTDDGYRTFYGDAVRASPPSPRDGRYGPCNAYNSYYLSLHSAPGVMS